LGFLQKETALVGGLGGYVCGYKMIPKTINIAPASGLPKQQRAVPEQM